MHAPMVMTINYFDARERKKDSNCGQTGSIDLPSHPRKSIMKRFLLAISLALLSATPALASVDDHGRRHGHGHDGDDGDSHGKHKGRYKHEMHRGEHVPVVYLQRDYYVEDYRVYHLAPPPRGHRWIRTDDGKYILIAVATGIIADIILHH
jgi:Ni/Co efflux regulator RcnB